MIEIVPASKPRRLDPFIAGNPRFVTVLDTDAILSSINNHARTNRPSMLTRLGLAGTARHFAARHVLDEVYRRIPKIAQTSTASRTHLLELFEVHYLPLIRFVDVSDQMERAHGIVGQVTDATDRPTAVLATLIGPCVVLSGDKHLRGPGIAPDRWRAAAEAGIAMMYVDQFKVGTAFVAHAGSAGLYSGTRALARSLEVPAWLVGLGLAAAIYFVFSAEERRARWIATLRPVVDRFAQHLVELIQNEQRASVELQRATFTIEDVPTIERQLSVTLSRARAPMLAKELQASVAATGFSEPSLAEIRAALNGDRAFCQESRYRWRLGTTVTAPQS